MALTDHDTTAGVAEAQAAGVAHGVEVIAGIEISTDLAEGERVARRDVEGKGDDLRAGGWVVPCQSLEFP